MSRIAIIGSGGREHAMAMSMTFDAQVKEVFVLPGNDGMATDKKISCHDVDVMCFESLKEFFLTNPCDLVVIGPEAPLAKGIVNYLEKLNIKVWGPHQDHARLESSKAFSKEFMLNHDIPSTEFYAVGTYEKAKEVIQMWSLETPPVIKADGLHGGKGVFVTNSKEEALEVIRKIYLDDEFSIKDKKLVIEARATGRELSALLVCNGKEFISLGFATDHKRLLSGDKGPNTGGMGVIVDQSYPGEKLKEKINDQVIIPTLKGLKDYKGFLFIGLMIDGDEINVLEYNVRLGDPETQALMPLLKTPLSQVLLRALNNDDSLWREDLIESNNSLHVVMCSQNYPDLECKGMLLNQTINIQQDLESSNVYFAGVRQVDNGLVNSGGRVLGVTITGLDKQKINHEMQGSLKKIHFNGACWRDDIVFKI